MICRLSCQVNPENRDERDWAPKGGVCVCQAVCNPLPVSPSPSPSEVDSAETHPESPMDREAAQGDRLWTPKARGRIKGFCSPKKRRIVLWPRKQVPIDLNDQWQSYPSTHFSMPCSVTLSLPAVGKRKISCLRCWMAPSFLNRWRVLS